jgi:hypothetical protein
MRSKLLLVLLTACILLPALTGAATLENTDVDDYRIQVVANGVALSPGVIYGGSSLYDVCDVNCQIRLLKTGQTISVQPGDYIIIDNGIMKRKED